MLLALQGFLAHLAPPGAGVSVCARGSARAVRRRAGEPRQRETGERDRRERLSETTGYEPLGMHAAVH